VHALAFSVFACLALCLCFCRKEAHFDFYAEGYVSSGARQETWLRMLQVRALLACPLLRR
jgi:hypothetical protein